MRALPLVIAALAAVGIYYAWRLQPGEGADPAIAFEPIADPAGSGSDPLAAVTDAIAPSAASTAAANLLEQLGSSMPKSTWTPPARADAYREPIAKAEQQYGMPPQLLARVLYQESRFRPEIINGSVKSPAGAVGIAQFLPTTAKDLGIDPLNPSQAIDGAARYLRQLYDRFGSWSDALAAYNWGQGNLARKGIARAPAETQKYVAQISTDIGRPRNQSNALKSLAPGRDSPGCCKGSK